MERSGTFLNACQHHEFSSAKSRARLVGETRSGYHVKGGYPRFARRRGRQHVLDQAISARRVDCTAFARMRIGSVVRLRDHLGRVWNRSSRRTTQACPMATFENRTRYMDDKSGGSTKSVFA